MTQGGWKKVMTWRYDGSHQAYPRHEALPGWERLTVRDKINVWNTAAAKGCVPRHLASYIDLLDLPIALTVQNLAAIHAFTKNSNYCLDAPNFTR